MNIMTKSVSRADESLKTHNGQSLVDTLQLKKAALILRAINHPLRQQMMKVISGAGKICVTDLYIKLRLEQSVASQHLAILRKAGFVQTEREGKQVYYSVNYPRLHLVQAVARQLLDY